MKIPGTHSLEGERSRGVGGVVVGEVLVDELLELLGRGHGRDDVGVVRHPGTDRERYEGARCGDADPPPPGAVDGDRERPEHEA
jgi:hypothetical protein